MNQPREPVEVKALLQGWLVEEGFQVREVEDPRAHFNLATQHPAGIRLHVAQPRDRKDRVMVVGKVELSPRDLSRFRSLEAKAREDFLWDLRFALITNQVQFQLLPNAHDPTAILLTRAIWYDGLTKHQFMETLQRVVDAAFLTIWKFRRLLGTTTPEEPPFYH